MTTMTEYSRVILLLSETNPRLARTVDAVGCGANGEALPGLLGWLPDGALIDLARAMLIVWGTDITDRRILSYVMQWDQHGAWRHPRSEEDQRRYDAARRAWGTQEGYS